MKKLITLLMATIMMLAMATSAWAANVGTDETESGAYTTIKDALDAGETKITLTSDITLTSSLTIDQSITIDGKKDEENNYKLIYYGSSTQTTGIINITTTDAVVLSNLEITDGNNSDDITGSNNGTGIVYESVTATDDAEIELTLNNVDINVKYYCVRTNECSYLDIEIYNSNLVAWNAIYHRGCSHATWKVDLSVLNGTNKFYGSSNSFATIVINCANTGVSNQVPSEDVTFTMTNSEVRAYTQSDQGQKLISVTSGTSATANNITFSHTDCEFYIEDELISSEDMAKYVYGQDYSLKYNAPTLYDLKVIIDNVEIEPVCSSAYDFVTGNFDELYEENLDDLSSKVIDRTDILFGVNWYHLHYFKYVDGIYVYQDDLEDTTIANMTSYTQYLSAAYDGDTHYFLVESSMMPDEDDVARIIDEDGYHFYTTLEAAIEDADSGDTVTVLADVNITSSITIEDDITITSNEGVVVTTGYGVESSGDADTANNFIVAENTTVKFDGVTFNVAGYYWASVAIYAKSGADITVNNCVFNAKVAYGDNTYALSTVRSYDNDINYSLEFTNNTVDGDFRKALLIYLDEGDVLEVTGNEFLADTGETALSEDKYSAASGMTIAVTDDDAEVIITNNKFEKYKKLFSVDNSTKTGEWTLTDNIFIDCFYTLDLESDNTVNTGYSLAYNYYEYANVVSAMKVLDSTTNAEYVYDTNPSDLVFYPYYTNSTMTELDYGVASVTSGSDVSYYGSLATAVAAAADGDTITLLEDITVTETINIYDGANLTIEGNGHKITSEITGDAAANAIFVAEIGYDNNTAGREVTVSLHDIVFEQSTKAPVIAGGYYNLSLLNISVEDCVFNGTGTSSSLCWIINSTSIGTLNFVNNEVNGDYYKPIYAVVSMPDYSANITIVGNTFTGAEGNKTAGGITINLHNQFADMEELDTANITITGNTFENRNKVICIDSCATFKEIDYDFGTTFGNWNITGNKFINTNYALNYDSDNEYNSISMAYNFFGETEDSVGSVVGLLDESENDPGTNEITLYPYYADAALTTLVYLSEDGEEEVTKTVEEATTEALENVADLAVESLTTEEKKTVSEAASVVTVLVSNQDDSHADEELVESLNALDELFEAAVDNLSTNSVAPTSEVEVSESAVDTSTGVEVSGLALSVFGGNEDAITSTTSVYVAVTEKDPETVDLPETVTVEETTFVLEIKPMVTVDSAEAEVIENHELQTPVTFKIYLSDNFDGNRATVVHIKEDGSTDEYSLTVYTDENGDYIQLTVSEFSNFVVTPYTYVASSSSVKKYSNDLEVGDGGSAYATPLSASSGTTVYINVTPNAGYEVDEVLVDGGDITVTDNEDGTYSYKQPAYAVDIEVTFVATDDVEEEVVEESDEALTDFEDVVAGAWYEEYVAAAVEEGIMQGNSSTEFAPNGTTTRAMMIQVLFNMSDEPETANDESAWYSEALAWGVEYGITDGSDITGNLTREQLVTMLYRYAMSNGVDVSVGEDTNILSYNDALDVADWAMDAFQWACGAGIINGDTDGNLNPDGNATRAELAKIMVSYLAL